MGFPHHYYHAASIHTGEHSVRGHAAADDLLRLVVDSLDVLQEEKDVDALGENGGSLSSHPEAARSSRKRKASTSNDDQLDRARNRVPRDKQHHEGLLDSLVDDAAPFLQDSPVDGPILTKSEAAAHVLSLNLEISIQPESPFSEAGDERGGLLQTKNTYNKLVQVLVDYTEPIVPFDFLQVSGHQVQRSTLDKHLAQKRSSNDTPQMQLSVEGFGSPILAWSILADDDQWDTVAGRPSNRSKSKVKPGYWLDSLLELNSAVQNEPGQVEPRPGRYHIESQVRLCWIPSEDNAAEVKILISIKAFIDLNVSLEQHLGFSPRHSHFESDRLILYTMLPPNSEMQQRHLQEAKATGLRTFYDALSPSPPLGPSLQKAMQPAELTATLLPFQLRSVAWLCFREGMQLEGYEGRPDLQVSTSIWESLDLGTQGRFWFCRLTSDIRKDEGANLVRTTEPSAVDWRPVKGTLLSEEMGLGKTLEAIGVMMLHRHPLSGPRASSGSRVVPLEGAHTSFDELKEWDETSQLFVEVVDATLVVTPTNLLAQWISEFKKHAPTMSICVYKGWRSLTPNDWTTTPDDDMNTAGATVIGAQGEMSSEPAKQRLFIDFVRQHDVVLTTYNALAEDATVAKAIAPRARRKHVEYREEERPRSPLVMAKWWRVCMDEVQMQNDRISADMVSLIPREFSLAISGTPAKRGTSDLVQTLRFLRVPVIPHSPKLWDKLQRPLYHATFVELFSQIAVRTTKADVHGELTIPRQTRMIIPIELSSIEMHYYLETLDACRQALLIDDTGQPIGDTWTLDQSELRASLMRLRQICTHLQVGQLGKTADSSHLRIVLGRELMTMEAALDRMLSDHQQNQLLVLRGKLSQSVKKAQLICMDDTDDLRLLKAGTIYSNVCQEAERAISLCQETIESLRLADDMAAPSSASDDDSDEDDVVRDASYQEDERQRKARLTSANSSLREMSLILHQATFFSGDVAHMKGDIDAENAFYAAADRQRSAILRSALAVARRGIRAVKTSIDDFSLLEIEPREDESGIYSKVAMENANHLVELLNDNAELLWNWRGKIVALLATPLEAPAVIVTAKAEPAEPEDLDAAKDVDGVTEKDHYQIALEAQGEIEAYLAAYASALADRREMLMEERSLLQQHEARIQGQIISRANLSEIVNDDTANLLRELTAEREAIMKARRNKKPLKAALLAFNDIRNKTDKSSELFIADSHAKWVRQAVVKQGSHVEKLLKEIDGLRSSFNTRVSYFAALQVVSDSVHAPTIEKSVKEDVKKISDVIDEYELQLARLASRTKYLKSLGKQQSQPDFTREDCVICFGSSDAEHGCLLSCGHAFCKSCLQRHSRSAQGKQCPMCKMTIERRAISVFRYPSTVGKDEKVDVVNPASPAQPSAKVDPETAAASAVVKEDESNQLRDELSKLRVIDADQRAAIEECDMIGDFGSKINFLVKHLHYLATHQPGARHVVFSNWRDSLKIVAVALSQNGINYVSLDQGSRVTNVAEKFRTDKSISVFLLHAERESAGLTLTAARMVHLLEPVLSHGFELQAIGRVDRLGQEHETTVYCYSTKDTVESRILARGIRNGDSIYLKDGVTVEQENVAPAAAKGGDANAGDAQDLIELLC